MPAGGGEGAGPLRTLLSWPRPGSAFLHAGGSSDSGSGSERTPTCGCKMKFAYRVSSGLGGGSGRASEGLADAGETEVLGISAACGSTGGPARRKLLPLSSTSHTEVPTPLEWVSRAVPSLSSLILSDVTELATSSSLQGRQS